MSRKIFILGIAGASGSGKTYLSNMLHEKLGQEDSVILAVDSYYRQQEVPFEIREKTNYDHPDSLELGLLATQLAELRAGKTIKVPVYDYSIHNRSGEFEEVEPKKCIIVEGILTFHLPEVRALLDYTIFVQTPLEECFTRRMSRDTVERGRTKESVNSQWNATVLPMFKEYCEPTSQYADVVCRGDFSYSDLIDQLTQMIAGKSAEFE